MIDKKNWIDLGLTPAEEERTWTASKLYRAQYIDTIDTVFEIAAVLEMLRNRNYGKGIQGSYAAALIQYGFTNRSGGEMDRGLRSQFKELLDNQDDVRNWWINKVTDIQKRVWHSASAIFKNWEASKKPKTPTPPKTPSRKMPGEPVVEPWAQPGSGGGKPPVERMEAKARQEAETEAKHLEMKATADGATINSLKEELQRLRIERAGLLSEIEDLKAKVAQLETENGNLRAAATPKKKKKRKKTQAAG